MRDFLRFYSLPDPNSIPQTVAHYLDELIYSLEREEIAREPYAVPMLWWLAHLISDEIPKDDSALAEELRSWFKELVDESRRRQELGRDLRNGLRSIE